MGFGMVCGITRVGGDLARRAVRRGGGLVRGSGCCCAVGLLKV
jgi:hypothetical protein